MKILQENPFLAGLVLVVVAGCAVMGFFLAKGAATFGETTMEYDQAVQRLHSLQNRVPFPDEANVAKAAGLRDAFAASLENLRAQFAALQRPLDPSITPQEFQDNLRATVNSLEERARAAKVPLPDDFYLGFDQYRDSLPSDTAAPHLARQLDFIAGIVGDLIGANPESPGVRSIDSLVRTTLPVEESRANKPRGEEPDAPADPSKLPFVIGFTAEQGKFRIALNALLKSDQFLIVRSLQIENSNPQGPPVARPADESVETLFGGEAENSAPGTGGSLNVLLGRELVKVQMRIEMVDFHFPVPEGGGDEQPEGGQ
jgi:hypothetical protein